MHALRRCQSFAAVVCELDAVDGGEIVSSVVQLPVIGCLPRSGDVPTLSGFFEFRRGAYACGALLLRESLSVIPAGLLLCAFPADLVRAMKTQREEARSRRRTARRRGRRSIQLRQGKPHVYPRLRVLGFATADESSVRKREEKGLRLTLRMTSLSPYDCGVRMTSKVRGGRMTFVQSKKARRLAAAFFLP